MKKLSHPAITAAHLAKEALCYIRQSSEKQVQENIGSTLYQRSLKELAIEFGWAPNLIKEFDSDLGRSGSTTRNRSAWQEMLNRIECDQVGAIICANIERLGRNLTELLHLYTTAARHNVILIDPSHVNDPKNLTDQFLFQIFGSVAQLDNRKRAETMTTARKTLAKAKYIVSNLPVGYIVNASGDVEKDAEVKEIVSLVFKKFLKIRSLRQTIVMLRREGVKLPSRYRRGKVSWNEPTIEAVRRMLTNRSYCGEYIYGKTAGHPELGTRPNGQSVRKSVPAEEWIVFENRLPKYITREQYAEVMAILRLNQGRPWVRIGHGAALAQGLLWCQNCGTRLTARYRGRRK
jgi:DNA invertase Pin-like site-specific DNA recombinase